MASSVPTKEVGLLDLRGDLLNVYIGDHPVALGPIDGVVHPFTDGESGCVCPE